jgi:hypothetical protein
MAAAVNIVSAPHSLHLHQYVTGSQQLTSAPYRNQYPVLWILIRIILVTWIRIRIQIRIRIHIRIRIQMRIKLYRLVRKRIPIPINLQMSSQNV